MRWKGGDVEGGLLPGGLYALVLAAPVVWKSR